MEAVVTAGKSRQQALQVKMMVTPVCRGAGSCQSSDFLCCYPDPLCSKVSPTTTSACLFPTAFFCFIGIQFPAAPLCQLPGIQTEFYCKELVGS